MKCTSQERNSCDEEKRGCEGCFYYEITEEERKAVKEVKDILNKEIEWGKNTSNDYKTVSDLYMNGEIEIILNLILKLKQENQMLKAKVKESYNKGYADREKVALDICRECKWRKKQ